MTRYVRNPFNAKKKENRKKKCKLVKDMMMHHGAKYSKETDKVNVPEY